jgi:ribosomal-protein-alanine N-acetyltransferase
VNASSNPRVPDWAPRVATPAPEIRTSRLVLRRWRLEDREPFAAMNGDSNVMEYFSSVLTRAESDAMVDRIERQFDNYGYGLWAVDCAEGFIGFVGLAWVNFDAHFTPALEIGWRLARPAWGRGYATEAALAARDYAFTEVGVDDIVSITTRTNTRSQAVMRKIGLTYDPGDDFAHPRLAADHPLVDHVLYRMSRDHWRTIR